MKRNTIDDKNKAWRREAVELDPDDRRKEPRYAPVHARAYLGWWEGDEFHTELGYLENLSVGGAAILAGRAPGKGHLVWLCVLGPNRSMWTTALVVRFERGVVRLAFAERLPYDVFKAVVWGYPAGESAPSSPPVARETGVQPRLAVAVALCD